MTFCDVAQCCKKYSPGWLPCDAGVRVEQADKGGGGERRLCSCPSAWLDRDSEQLWKLSEQEQMGK